MRVTAPNCPGCQLVMHRLYSRARTTNHVGIGWVCPRVCTIRMDLHRLNPENLTFEEDTVIFHPTQ